MGKRGSATNEIYFFLFELLLVLSVGLVLYQYSTSITGDTTLQRILLSRDISLTRNTLQSIPSVSQYTYKFQEDTSFFYSFNESNTAISENQEFPKGYNSFLNSLFNYDYPPNDINGINEIYFSIYNNQFYLSDDSSDLPTNKGFICPLSTPFKGSNILILSGHLSPSSLTPDSTTLSSNVAENLNDILTFPNSEVLNGMASLNLQDIKDEILTNAPNVTLSFIFNSTWNENKFIVSYPSSKRYMPEKSKLACLICNELSGSFDYPCLVRPIDPDIFHSETIQSILTLDEGLMIFVELGQLKSGGKLEQDLAIISFSFKNALEAFYE